MTIQIPNAGLVCNVFGSARRATEAALVGEGEGIEPSTRLPVLRLMRVVRSLGARRRKLAIPSTLIN